MSLQKRNIGRIPVYFGDWDSAKTYGKKNRVTLYGSEFESKIDNNINHAPATYNAATHVVTFDTDRWYIISNGTDAYFAAQRMDDMQDQIDAIIRSQSNITISLNPSVIYAGVATTVQINASISTIGTVSTFTLSRNGSQIAQSTSASVAGTTSVNETGNQTIVADAQIKSSHVTKNATLYVVYPIYYGGGSAYTDATTKAAPRTSPAGTYNVNVPANGKYVFFNVPASMSINKATVSGFDMPLNTPVNVTIDGQSYKSYKSVNTYDAGTLTVVLS